MLSDTLPVILYKISAGRHGYLAVCPRDRRIVHCVTLGRAVVVGDIQACSIPFGGGGISNAPFVGLIVVHQHPPCSVIPIECAIIVLIGGIHRSQVVGDVHVLGKGFEIMCIILYVNTVLSHVQHTVAWGGFYGHLILIAAWVLAVGGSHHLAGTLRVDRHGEIMRRGCDIHQGVVVRIEIVVAWV